VQREATGDQRVEKAGGSLELVGLDAFELMGAEQVGGGEGVEKDDDDGDSEDLGAYEDMTEAVREQKEEFSEDLGAWENDEAVKIDGKKEKGEDSEDLGACENDGAAAAEEEEGGEVEGDDEEDSEDLGAVEEEESEEDEVCTILYPHNCHRANSALHTYYTVNCKT
jgi:hypothetical protein